MFTNGRQEIDPQRVKKLDYNNNLQFEKDTSEQVVYVFPCTMSSICLILQNCGHLLTVYMGIGKNHVRSYNCIIYVQ